MTSVPAAMVPDVFRAYLSKLLSNHSRGISIVKFASYFVNWSKDRIKFELYGYTSLTDMLEDLPDVCKVVKTSETVMVYPVEEALKMRSRYRLDKRPDDFEKTESNVIKRVMTSLGEVILLRFGGALYVPTCCLAQLAGFTKDSVLEILEEDGLCVSGVRYLNVGDREHEEFRLRIALWCPLACSETKQIQERIALVPLASCDFILGSISPDIPQDNAVRKLRILSSVKMNQA